MTTTRVLIVDDHRMFADSLVRLLDDQPDFEVVGLAGTLADAVSDAATLGPDVVLLDFRLPDGDAPECVARLAEAAPEARVLVMTGLDDQETMGAIRDAGCTVVTKDRAASDLIASLRAVAGRAADVSEVRPTTRSESGDSATAALVSDRERDVLVKLAQGLSTQEVADALHISVTTVRNHVQRALAKLGAHSRLEAVAIAIQKGIIAPQARDV